MDLRFIRNRAFATSRTFPVTHFLLWKNILFGIDSYVRQQKYGALPDSAEKKN